MSLADISDLAGLSPREARNWRVRETRRERRESIRFVALIVDNYILSEGLPVGDWRSGQRLPRRGAFTFHASQADLLEWGFIPQELRERKKANSARWKEANREHLSAYERTPRRRAHSRKVHADWYARNREAYNAKRRAKRAEKRRAGVL